MFWLRDRFGVAQRQGQEPSTATIALWNSYDRSLPPERPPGAAPCNLSLERFFIDRPRTRPSHPTARKQVAGQQHRQLVTTSQVSAAGYVCTTCQRQRALDRPVLPEFMHLSEAFHASLKTLSARMESGFSLMEHGFNHMEHLNHSSDQRLERLEADLNRPAHHFFSKIERGMADHLSPEQQLSVLQACNTAFLQAMQQNQYMQQSVLSFPPVSPLSRFITVPTSAAYHCTATCIPSQAGHHYTTPMLSAAGHSTPATTISSVAPVCEGYQQVLRMQ
ncbi:uncharacterized protein [Dendrobates tinctorius]|uniref:uncharacterized protein n=1 Tax=Dendrobates tinctorius TaxID=92724 RepID=UPI003CC953CC